MATARGNSAFVQPRGVEVAAGPYSVRGAPGEFGPANLGRIGNAGFIVGGDGVVAVDTGTSYRRGLALGEDAAQCARRQRVQHTAMYTPHAVFDDSHRVEGIGRSIRVRYFGMSSGPGDIAVHDVASGALLAGGLLDQGCIPGIAGGDHDGWPRALTALRCVSAATIVPGHGPAGTADVIDLVERYLNALEARVTRTLEGGVGLSEIADRAALPEFAAWDPYAAIQRRNGSVLYLSLESR